MSRLYILIMCIRVSRSFFIFLQIIIIIIIIITIIIIIYMCKTLQIIISTHEK